MKWNRTHLSREFHLRSERRRLCPGWLNYCRSLKELQLMKEVFLQLQFDVFSKEYNNVQVHKEHIDMLAELRGMVDSSSNQSVSFSASSGKSAEASTVT